MYSQNDEERVILEYFNGKPTGCLLDIGANDGKTLSNSRALMERGWNGVFVEPDPIAFGKLNALYKDEPRAMLYQTAIGRPEDSGKETAKFWSSGTHLNKGDTGLLSTLSEKDKARWTKEKFSATEVPICSYMDLEDAVPDNWKPFDFISIDAEGYDLVIMQQINLVNTKLLCIEFNSDAALRVQMSTIARLYGLRVIHTTHENLIFAR